MGGDSTEPEKVLRSSKEEDWVAVQRKKKSRSDTKVSVFLTVTSPSLGVCLHSCMEVQVQRRLLRMCVMRQKS